MAEKPDFDKVWASNSPLAEYTFSDKDYLEGWNFVGSTPPARGMFDALQKKTDEKLKYLDNAITGGEGVDDKIKAHNESPTAHQDIRDLIASAGGGGQATYFYTDGTYTVPDGVSVIYVSGCAGGASGGYWGGGGGGEACYRKAISVTPGETIDITIGEGGTGFIDAGLGSSMVYGGNDGGNTTFGSYITLHGGKYTDRDAVTKQLIVGYAGGNGATDGELAHLIFFVSTSNFAVQGGKGGDTLFGKGGSGGAVSTSGTSILVNTPAKMGIGYGSGGGGRGNTVVNSSTNYYSASGSGANGIIIIETA